MRIQTFLEQSPVFQTGRVARKLDASLTLALAPEQVTPFEALVLAAIFFEKRTDVKPSALAEAFETTRGNISHSISALESRGLVARRIDPDDARAVRLSVTPLGRRRAVRIAAILDRIQRRLETDIGPAVLTTMLQQLNTVEQISARPARTSKRS